MSLHCDRRLLNAWISMVLLGAGLSHRVGAAPLKICIDQANPTAAMDLRVVRAAARTQDAAVEMVPFLGYGKGDDGFPPSRFAAMAKSDCALIMGFPVDASNPNLPDKVLATSAYATTGFALVRRGSARNMELDRLPNGSEVGIAQLDTYAGLLYGTHPNIVMHVYEREASMLADLAAGRIAGGLAWQPSIAAYQHTHPAFKTLNVRVLPDRHMLWNLVALYAPESSAAAELFNKGLADLNGKGALKALISPYGQAATSAVAHASANQAPANRASAERVSAEWPLPHLRSAVAWDIDPRAVVPVADRPGSAGPVKKTKKAVPALFTEDQATKGALAYYQNCAMCHGPNLDGQPGGYSGPALKGADFADPSYDFHVDEIFNFVAKLMPAATPGSLSHEQDVQIMAFILQQNGYPAGAQELVYEAAEKSRVPIRFYKK